MTLTDSAYKMECIIHNNNPVSLLCVTCDHSPVCNDCIVTDHNGHKFLKAQHLVERDKDLLSKVALDNKQLISDLQSDLLEIASAEEVQDKACHKACKQIDDQRTLLHKLVDDVAHDFKQQCQNEKKKNIKKLDEQNEAIKKHLIFAKKFDSDLEDAVNSGDEMKIIQTSKGLKPLNYQRTSILFPNEVEFERRNVDTSCLHDRFGIVINKPIDSDICSDFFGCIFTQKPTDANSSSDQGGAVACSNITNAEEDQTVSVTGTFKTSIGPVNTLAPIHADSCWITSSSDSTLFLVDRTGIVSNSIVVEGRFCGIANNLKHNKLYTCGLLSQCILRINLPEGSVKPLFSTAPFFPSGIACTTANELLVIESTVCTMTFKNSKGSIVRYTTKGKVIDRSDNPCFAALGRIHINHSEDTILVTNYVSRRLCCLMLLNKDLSVRMSYLGRGQVLKSNPTLEILKYSDSNFRISDICTDRQGNIILSEVCSQSVEMLNSECQHLKTLFIGNKIPISVAVSESKEIWISFTNLEIKICKLL